MIDSNVLFSAFISRGICDEIVESVLTRHNLILCEEILVELKKNLSKKAGVPDAVIEEYVKLLKINSVVHEPRDVDVNACRDKHDLMVLGAADAGNAAVIITGDNDLLVIKSYKNISIISPRGSMKLLKT
ncbi:MAG: putative toxin-antitoxin system toxin component, PIN family [Bdellovibrionales bacterium RIFOXYB2_FULL_36_6]|nr:MAG: putative toxin-antitoxin system toxin component, PIN family [Bdellovibrionales bacterium RIFOXYB2_FULL_36_6]